MKFRKIITGVISVLLIAAALCLLGQFHLKLDEARYTFEEKPLTIYSIATSFLVFFAAFMAMKNWFEFFKARHIKIRVIFLIPGLLLLIFGMIPNFFWVKHFGMLPINPYKTLYYSSYVRLAISALSGVLIGRAFGHKEVNRRYAEDKQAEV